MQEFELQLKALQKQVELLTKENKVIKQKELDRLEKEYKFVVNEIANVVDNGDVVQNRFQNLRTRMDTNEILIDLTEVNNPNSDVLGFKFVDIIVEAAETHFIQKLEKDEDKSRFRKIIDRVVKNPVISAVIQSNPVTSLVSSVIDKATNFFSASRVGQKVKEIDVEVKSVFDEERIEKFYQSIQKYVNFYDKLIEATRKYNFLVDELNVKYVHLSSSFKGYYSTYLSEIGISSDSSEAISVQLRNILTPTEVSGEKDYQSILDNPRVQNAFEKSKDFAVLKQQIEQYIADYHTVLEGYLSSCTTALNLVEGFVDDTMDKTKLSDLKKKIEGFVGNNNPI